MKERQFSTIEDKFETGSEPREVKMSTRSNAIILSFHFFCSSDFWRAVSKGYHQLTDQTQILSVSIPRGSSTYSPRWTREYIYEPFCNGNPNAMDESMTLSSCLLPKLGREPCGDTVMSSVEDLEVAI